MDINLDPVQELATLTENMNKLTALLEELEKNIEVPKEEPVPEVLETDKIALGSYELEPCIYPKDKLVLELPLPLVMVLNTTPIEEVTDTTINQVSGSAGNGNSKEFINEHVPSPTRDEQNSYQWMYNKCVLI